MEDYNDNIPDENIKIISPKKCFFLLNNMNMFINSEKKRKNFEQYMKINKTEKLKDNSSEDSEDLKTIIKEPAILTSKIILDIRGLINSKNKNNKEIKENNYEKIKKNTKISLYKKIKNKENINNKLNNNIKNNKTTNKKNINLKNDNKQHQNTNLTQTPKIKNNESGYQKEIIHNNNKPKEKNNLIQKNNEKKNLQNKNKIFVKKISKEIKNKEVKNSLSISKKGIQKEKQGIITKKILIKPEILAAKNSIEIKNKLYSTQKELLPNIMNKEIIENKEIISNNKKNKNVHFSKSNKNLLEEKNKYKSKIFHIDYSQNKKIDLTKTIIGLNAIKDLFYKKLKKNFLKLKTVYIYKKKIISNIIMTPKQSRYTRYNTKEKIEFIMTDINRENEKGEKSKSIEQKNLNANNYEINKKTFQTMPKFYNYYEKNNNIYEFDNVIERKIKTNYIYKYKKNSVLLLNRNSYINNCNINSVQINLFNNEYVNNINSNNNNQKEEIKTKSLSEKNIEKYFGEPNLIKTYRTSYKEKKK